MKARMLADSTDGKVKKGTILEDRECYWLCGIKQVQLLPLGGDKTDVIQLDEMQAEPADEECLKVCLARKWVKPGFVLTPVPEPVAEPVVVAPELEQATAPAEDQVSPVA